MLTENLNTIITTCSTTTTQKEKIMIAITGYEKDGNCEHCGRVLKHCIRLSDGRLVGATCFDKKVTTPKIYQGKKYRVGSEHIIKLAKVAQFVNPSNWSRYGLNNTHFIFSLA